MKTSQIPIYIGNEDAILISKPVITSNNKTKCANGKGVFRDTFFASKLAYDVIYTAQLNYIFGYYAMIYLSISNLLLVVIHAKKRTISSGHDTKVRSASVLRLIFWSAHHSKEHVPCYHGPMIGSWRLCAQRSA